MCGPAQGHGDGRFEFGRGGAAHPSGERVDGRDVFPRRGSFRDSSWEGRGDRVIEHGIVSSHQDGHGRRDLSIAVGHLLEMCFRIVGGFVWGVCQGQVRDDTRVLGRKHGGLGQSGQGSRQIVFGQGARKSEVGRVFDSEGVENGLVIFCRRQAGRQGFVELDALALCHSCTKIAQGRNSGLDLFRA